MFRAAMAGLVLNWCQKLSTFLSALCKQRQERAGRQIANDGSRQARGIYSQLLVLHAAFLNYLLLRVHSAKSLWISRSKKLAAHHTAVCKFVVVNLV